MLRSLTILTISLALPAIAIGQTAKSTKQSSKMAWCHTSTTSCFVAKAGQTWENAFPDERERDLIKRVNHTNAPLHPGKVLKIPNNLSHTEVLDHSPMPRSIEPIQQKLMIFDPSKHAWGAYDSSGNLVHWGPATGGANWCADVNRGCRTKQGDFRIYNLGGPACKSSKFPVGKGGAPMPYCMFFNGGQAFHGSPGGVMKGHASHGCVRLFVEDAKWLRYNFIEGPHKDNGHKGTKVIVLPYGS